MQEEQQQRDHRHDYQVYGRRDGRPVAFVVRASNPWMAGVVAHGVMVHNGGCDAVSVHDYFTGKLNA